MAAGPLVSAEALASGSDAPTLLDVRWTLGGPPGRDEYDQGHIPGAAFVDLDSDLSAPPGTRGRHPLPEQADFQSAMRAAGVSNARAVVVYDGATSMSAARAWWLLRYFGHGEVAVLDGGIAAWIAAGYPVTTDLPEVVPGDFVARPGGMPVLDIDQAAALAIEGLLLDARAPERFSGDWEPVDPVGGHIPGARNAPTTLAVDESGRFRRPAELRQIFERTGVGPDVELGAYCGSGVTAAHEVLALELAGYRAALYPGSWSEWIADPQRAVARGR